MIINFLPRWIVDRCRNRSRLIVDQRSTRFVSFSIRESRIRVVNGRIFSVLAVVLGLVRIRDTVTSQDWWWNVYTGTLGFESSPRSAILHFSNISSVVHESVFSEHFSSWIFRLDLVRTIRSLVSVTVATVFVVSSSSWNVIINLSIYLDINLMSINNSMM